MEPRGRTVFMCVERSLFIHYFFIHFNLASCAGLGDKVINIWDFWGHYTTIAVFSWMPEVPPLPPHCLLP